MTKQLRKPPEPGNLRADRNWYRETDDQGMPREDVSWHFLRSETRTPGVIETVCGLTLSNAQVSPEGLPHGKSCETCLRIDAGSDEPIVPPPTPIIPAVKEA